MARKQELHEEVLELTALLRTDDSWSNLRTALESAGMRMEEILLSGFHEDEEEREYGVVFEPRQGDFFEFTRSSKQGAKGFLSWKKVDDLDRLAETFPAVVEARNVARRH